MTKIIGGNSCKKIACDLSGNLMIEYIDPIVTRFMDSTLSVEIPARLYGQEVIIVQSICNPANDNLMELLLLIDAAKRLGGSRIIVIMPYFGYGRQDRSFYEGGGPVTARLVANMIESAGADHIITLDLHSKQVEGFFSIGVQNIESILFFAPFLNKFHDVVVVSPDIGGVARAKKFADELQTDLVIINKTRNIHNCCDINGIIGDVLGRNCLIVDDIIDTGDTIFKASALLKKQGAGCVNVIATHAVLSGNAKQKLSGAEIDSFMVTNSILQEVDMERFRVIDVVAEISRVIAGYINFAL